MNIPFTSTTELLEGHWWDEEWKSVQMGTLGAPPHDSDEGYPDELEEKVESCGDVQEMFRVPRFKSFQPCLSQPCGLGQVA